MRKAKIERKTAEVNITVELNIDGTGRGLIETGIKFLDHLLIILTKHGLFDLKIIANGDLNHHISEDVALTLGQALEKALGKKRGIKRFGFAYVPMDDALARATVDLGGRAHSKLDLQLSKTRIEDSKTEDIIHFFTSFAHASKSNVHISVLYGKNNHHKIEAATKALALALRQAVELDTKIQENIPSTKGVI